MSRYGASQFASLLKECVLWWPGEHVSISNTAKTITANGNVTQVTTIPDPWGMSRPVAYFDGSGDYLLCGSLTNWNFLHQVGTSSGKWTIKFWIKWLNRSTGGNVRLMGTCSDSTQHGIYINFLLSRVLTGGICYGVNNSTICGFSSFLYPDDSDWHYMVLAYNHSLSSGNFKLYFDGNLVVSNTKANTPSTNNATYNLTIGSNVGTYNYCFQGYLSDVCIKSGIDEDGTIVPISRSKPDPYTKLLLHMYGSGSTFTDDPFIDYDCYPILPAGVTVTNNGTFTKTSLGNNKSVLNFDGSTNYISLTDNDAWDIWNGDFTVCGWVKLGSVATDQNILGQFVNPAYTRCYWSTTNGFTILCKDSSGTSIAQYTASYTPVVDVWYHVTFIRSGSSCLIYANASQLSVTATVEWGTIPNLSTPMQIGMINAVYFTGNIKDLMIWKGRALTQPEIKLLMNRTHPETGAGLMPANGDYYKLS